MGVVEVKIFFGSSGQTVTSMKKKKLIDYQEHPDLSTSLSYLTTLNSLTVITSLTTPYLLPWPAPTHNTTLINPTTQTIPATSDNLATLSSRDPSGLWEWEKLKWIRNLINMAIVAHQKVAGFKLVSDALRFVPLESCLEPRRETKMPHKYCLFH